MGAPLRPNHGLLSLRSSKIIFFMKGELPTKTRIYLSLPISNPNLFSVATRPRSGANPIWGHFEPPPLEIIYYFVAAETLIWGSFEHPLP